MLIYVNQFNIPGSNNDKKIFSAIAGWLKQITGKHFSINDLKSCNNYQADNCRVRTFSATEYPPLTYSILLSHPDKENPGRQWITEIGVEIESDACIVSILLEVSDVSTQIKTTPHSTRPGFIRYLLKNTKLSRNTVGLDIKTIKNEKDDFKSLQYEIEREDRFYPIVLISEKQEPQKTRINPRKLQEQLVGLAQVVYCNKEINSWDMEDFLGKRYSAWDGAINIIYPSYGKNFCKNKLLLSGTIEKITEEKNITHEILSIITHTSNGKNKKKHFSPSDVRAKRQRDKWTTLKNKFEEISTSGDFRALAEQAFEQLSEQDSLFEKEREENKQITELLEKEIADLSDEISELKSTIRGNKILIEELSKNKDQKGKCLVTYGTEKDKYKDEVYEIILDSLKKHLETCEKFTRRYDVICDILTENKSTGVLEEAINAIENSFQVYDGSNHKIKSLLKDYNLELEEDGSHNKLKFIHDDRYKMSFSKTPSDKKRSGKNIIQQAKSMLF